MKIYTSFRRSGKSILNDQSKIDEFRQRFAERTGYSLSDNQIKELLYAYIYGANIDKLINNAIKNAR